MEMFMKLSRSLSQLAGVLAICAGAAQAAPFSYDYVEGGYGEVDRGDALFFGGSSAIDKNLYVLGAAHLIDFPNGIDGFYLQGGIGYHVPLTAEADFFINGQLLYADIDAPGSDSDLGIITRAGLRFMPAPKVELEGALAFSSNDNLVDDGIGLNISGRYHFTDQLSGALGLNSDTELDGVSLSVRYRFR
jgi:hypothetical protein